MIYSYFLETLGAITLTVVLLGLIMFVVTLISMRRNPPKPLALPCRMCRQRRSIPGEVLCLNCLADRIEAKRC